MPQKNTRAPFRGVLLPLEAGKDAHACFSQRYPGLLDLLGRPPVEGVISPQSPSLPLGLTREGTEPTRRYSEHTSIAPERDRLFSEREAELAKLLLRHCRCKLDAASSNFRMARLGCHDEVIHVQADRQPS